MSEATRAYIYRIVTVLAPLAVFYGLLAEQEAALWLGVVGAALNTGAVALAARHTSTGR